jgi:predicted peptidase
MKHGQRACVLSLWAGLLLAVVPLLGGCQGAMVASSTNEFPEHTGFTQRIITIEGQQHVVWVFVPKNYRPDAKFPAVLFLHGLFESGDGQDKDKVLSAGLGPVIGEDPGNWPFVTIFPQSTGTWQGEDRERLAIGALDYAQSQWSIDPDRVTLAGLSYGALGVWEIGAKHQDRFAALVPISGHKATEWVDRLLYVPVWAFSAKNDSFVPASGSEEMCREINQKGGWARLTEFYGGDHDCWALAVHESNLVNWMLLQHRRPPFAVNSPQQPSKPVMASMGTGG